jgi:hypothetical protein
MAGLPASADLDLKTFGPSKWKTARAAVRELELI